MSHVDEGMLHAYLDGALDSFPVAQAEQVRRHLAECDECRARLGEERAIRDEAAAILGGATLDVGDMPSFEELRARARAPRAAVAGSRMQRLAWAATVVLALGTGWILRGGIPRPGGSVDVLEDRADRAGAPPAATEAEADAAGRAQADAAGRSEADAAGRSEADVAGPAPADAAPTSVEPPPPPVARTAGTTAARGAPAEEAAVDRDARTTARAGADVIAGDSAAATGSAKPADLWAAARERMDRERLEARSVLPPPPAAANPLVSPTAVEPRPEQARRAVNLSGSADARPGEKAAAAGSSLVVPGLPVVSVTWLDEPGLVGAVRVLQLMEHGDTVEVVHLPAGRDPSLLPTRGDGRTQVFAPRGGGWVVLRGRTSADVLSGLLRRLGGGD